MSIDPSEIFADLIQFRKDIYAPEVHMNYTVRPSRFVIYDPANINARFHFMPCQTLNTAQRNGNITNLRRSSDDSGVFSMYGAMPKKLHVCGHCVNAWNASFPDRQLNANNFSLAEFFCMCEYDPHFWDGIDIPPEIDAPEHIPGCYLLYKPVKNSPFHFMKCKTVRYDESIGWIKSYRFTDNLSGAFELFSDNTHLPAQRLHVCKDCLAEWDNENGWKCYTSASDADKKAIADSFSIREFFGYCTSQENIPHELVELYTLMENHSVWFSAHVSNEYPANWTEITNMYRASRLYRCEQCGVDMSRFPELAITHHVNGSHPEIGPENMRVLCLICHSLQPHHDKTVKFTRYQYQLLLKLRKEQGIKRRPPVIQKPPINS